MLSETEHILKQHTLLRKLDTRDWALQNHALSNTKSTLAASWINCPRSGIKIPSVFDKYKQWLIIHIFPSSVK
jgi:hypothetical protein